MTAQELYNKRKWKLCILPEVEILRVLTGEIIISNIPPGSMLADCGYRMDMQGIGILILNESFPEVPNNETALMFEAEFKKLE